MKFHEAAPNYSIYALRIFGLGREALEIIEAMPCELPGARNPYGAFIRFSACRDYRVARNQRQIQVED